MQIIELLFSTFGAAIAGYLVSRIEKLEERLRGTEMDIRELESHLPRRRNDRDDND